MSTWHRLVRHSVGNVTPERIDRCWPNMVGIGNGWPSRTGVDPGRDVYLSLSLTFYTIYVHSPDGDTAVPRQSLRSPTRSYCYIYLASEIASEIFPFGRLLLWQHCRCYYTAWTNVTAVITELSQEISSGFGIMLINLWGGSTLQRHGLLHLHHVLLISFTVILGS